MLEDLQIDCFASEILQLTYSSSFSRFAAVHHFYSDSLMLQLNNKKYSLNDVFGDKFSSSRCIDISKVHMIFDSYPK